MNYIRQADDILKTKTIKASDLKDIITNNARLKDRAEYLEVFLSDLNNFTKYADVDGFSSVISDLKKGGSFTDGASYVLNHLKKNPDDFPVDRTTFEIRTSPNREMDVVVKKIGVGKFLKLFEFKSYKWTSLPPSGFADQFSKDLLNTKLESLKDLKWYFDAQKLGGKTELELVDFMMDEVRAMWKGLDVGKQDSILKKFKIEKEVGLEGLITQINSKNVFKIR